MELSKEQTQQLIARLEEFKTANETLAAEVKKLRQILHEKGVNERKVFRILNEVKQKLMNEDGEVSTIKAMELFTNDDERDKFFGEIKELNEVITYYESNTVQIK